MKEAVLCRSPSEIRELFSILICTCGLSNPLQLRDKYETPLSEDILHRFERMDQINNDLCLNETLRLMEDKLITFPERNCPTLVSHNALICRTIASRRAVDRFD
ncbi:ATP-dependent DNA helicase [Trichonephila clavipes]|nr:ATP-dependent DNA helicase [Trichonephila clavipes]